MRRFIVLTLPWIMITACSDPTILSKCDSPCYTGPAKTRSVGACRQGYTLCDKAGNVLRCEGEILPSVELCDGVDRDCNGVTDDSPQDGILGTECGAPRIANCVPGVYVCTETGIECQGGVLPEPETCNGRDDDCNGVVDDLAPQDLEFCYSGQPETLLHSPCHPGIIQCRDGVEVCHGEILPSPEICNGLDEDCNGIPDDGLNDDPDGTIDVVFEIDTSGSMANRIDVTKQTIRLVVDQLSGDDRYQFALLTYPYGPGYSAKVISDFTNSSTIARRVLIIGPDGGGLEVSYDLAYSVAVGTVPLSWREGSAKLQIMFTDEPGESAMNIDSFILRDALIAAGQRLYVFVDRNDASTFTIAAFGSGGSTFDFPIQNATEMASKITSIAIDVCAL